MWVPYVERDQTNVKRFYSFWQLTLINLAISSYCDTFDGHEEGGDWDCCGGVFRGVFGPLCDVMVVPQPNVRILFQKGQPQISHPSISQDDSKVQTFLISADANQLWTATEFTLETFLIPDAHFTQHQLFRRYPLLRKLYAGGLKICELRR